jgi:hypothetical protein
MRILFLVTLSLLSQASWAKLFKISKGEHYSSPRLTKAFVGTEMKMTVAFDESARYEFPPEAAHDQADTNKLYGFSDCGGSHMQNSARFGWRWYQNRLDIMAFTHRGGKFYFEYMTSIQPNRAYEGTIEISSDKKRYIYTFDGVRVEMDRGCQSERAIGYHLQPYFGGQQVAPHDVNISIKRDETTGPAVVESVYPNPSNGRFNLRISSFEQASFHFMLYDVSGRLVHRSEKISLPEGENQTLSFDLTRRFASGMYLLVPVISLDDGTELRAHIKSHISDKAMKLILMN